MTKSILVLTALLMISAFVEAQRFQMGFSATINNTFFHKGQSVYDNKYYNQKMAPGVGFSIPCNIALSDRWTLRSGIGFQTKKYHFEQNKYDFPGAVDKTGSFYFKMRFNTFEVPLVMCFSPRKNEGITIEYKIGCILTQNFPIVTTLGYSTFEYTGSDAYSYSLSSPAIDWNSYFSPDIYAGISFLKIKENTRRHELTLSFQYSPVPSTQSQTSLQLSTSTLTKTYEAILKPNLSCVALTYSYYPRWSDKKDTSGYPN